MENINTKKILFYLFGQFILALGISLSIKTDLGVSPVSSVPYAFSNVTGMELGNMTILVHTVYVFFQYLVLRKDFKLSNFLQILVGVLFGKCVTLTNLILKNVALNGLVLRYAMLGLSILLIAVGLKMYMWTDIAPQATDGLVNAISQKYQIAFSTVKNYFDICSVIVSAAVSLIFLGKILGIREGTVIAALLVGRVAHVIEKYSGEKAKAFLA
ncbi:MAG: hypothetical protein IJK53_04165 [Erysipelotrichaceae bacterium]|nr:hypothetical protein [Erysipelotrichaceae bacterium]